MQKNSNWSKAKKREDKIMTFVIYFIVSLVLLLLFVMCFYILLNGILSLDLKYIGFTKDSLLIQLFNTIYMVFLALLISVPIGIFVGVYLAEYLKEGKILSIIQTCIDTLSSIPSIVLGMFGSLMFYFLSSGISLIAGSLTLVIFTIPIIVRSTENALKEVDNIYRESSYGLGANKFQTIMKVLLPFVSSRIISGIVISASRCFAEAAALIYTAGSAPVNISFLNFNIFSLKCPFNIFRPADTLAVRIYYLETASILPDSNKIAAVAAAMLLILILFFNLIAKKISKNTNIKIN